LAGYYLIRKASGIRMETFKGISKRHARHAAANIVFMYGGVATRFMSLTDPE
jgi:hypothetical protein